MQHTWSIGAAWQRRRGCHGTSSRTAATRPR